MIQIIESDYINTRTDKMSCYSRNNFRDCDGSDYNNYENDYESDYDQDDDYKPKKVKVVEEWEMTDRDYERMEDQHTSFREYDEEYEQNYEEYWAARDEQQHWDAYIKDWEEKHWKAFDIGEQNETPRVTVITWGTNSYKEAEQETVVATKQTLAVPVISWADEEETTN